MAGEPGESMGLSFLVLCVQGGGVRRRDLGEGPVSRGEQAHQVHPKEGQAYLGDIAGLVPDPRNLKSIPQ